MASSGLHGGSTHVTMLAATTARECGDGDRWRRETRTGDVSDREGRPSERGAGSGRQVVGTGSGEW